MIALLTHTPSRRNTYYGAAALAALRAHVEVRLHGSEVPLDPAGLAEEARDVDLIVSDRLTAAPAPVFEKLPRLRAFLRCAVDIRNVDTEAASRAGILVTRASPSFAAAVSELAVGFMVDLARGVSRASAAYHAGAEPPVLMGRQLSGATAGIIGYGVIGRTLAFALAALGMTVVVSDPFAIPAEGGPEHIPLEALLERADFVICLAPATPETENLIDADAFRRMRRDAFFLNLSRGNLVDELALGEALRSRRIAGAALDVGRAPDQMPSPEVAALPNVVATPHIGGLTRQAVDAQAFETVEQVAAILAGAVPPGDVNGPAWTRRG